MEIQEGSLDQLDLTQKPATVLSLELPGADAAVFSNAGINERGMPEHAVSLLRECDNIHLAIAAGIQSLPLSNEVAEQFVIQSMYETMGLTTNDSRIDPRYITERTRDIIESMKRPTRGKEELNGAIIGAFLSFRPDGICTIFNFGDMRGGMEFAFLREEDGATLLCLPEPRTSPALCPRANINHGREYIWTGKPSPKLPDRTTTFKLNPGISLIVGTPGVGLYSRSDDYAKALEEYSEPVSPLAFAHIIREITEGSPCTAFVYQQR